MEAKWPANWDVASPMVPWGPRTVTVPSASVRFHSSWLGHFWLQQVGLVILFILLLLSWICGLDCIVRWVQFLIILLLWLFWAMVYLRRNPLLSAVVVIALAFNVDQIVFKSVADSTVLRMITLLLPPWSLHWLHMHITLRCRIYRTKDCMRADCIDLFICDEWTSKCLYNWMLLHGFQNRLHQHRLYTWVPLVLAHYLHNVYMTPSQVTVYMLIAQQGVSRDYTTVLHFTDPNMSPFLLIPDLLHLHWLHHGLHRGHNWLQCIAYSLHWRCAICHMIACIYSMKDPASALTALIIASASIKEVIVAQFFQDLVFSFAFQNSVGQIAYWTSFALPA